MNIRWKVEYTDKTGTDTIKATDLEQINNNFIDSISNGDFTPLERYVLQNCRKDDQTSPK